MPKLVSRYPRLGRRGAPLLSLVLALTLATIAVVAASLWAFEEGVLWAGILLFLVAVVIGLFNRAIADPYWQRVK